MRETIVSRGLLSPPPPDIFFDWKRSVLAAVRQPEKNRGGEDELCGKLRVGKGRSRSCSEGGKYTPLILENKLCLAFCAFFRRRLLWKRGNNNIVCLCVWAVGPPPIRQRRAKRERERKGNFGKNSFSSPAQDASLKIP